MRFPRSTDPSCPARRRVAVAAVGRGVAVAAVAAAVGCGPRAGPDPEPAPIDIEPAPSGRLGDAVRPLEAFLELEIDPEQPSFRGVVTIDLSIARPARTVWLHGQNLAIRSAQLHPAGGPPMRAGAIDAQTETGLLGLHFDAPVGAGKAQLQIEYSGQFREVDGLFRQKHAGQWYAYTDFEPIDARRAFPCFDDPRFKIPWSVSLIVPNTVEAFSNMPEAERTALDSGAQRIDFARTTPLSSYLVAAAVGPFEVVEGSDEPVPVRILAPRGLGQFGKFALDAIPPMLRYLESYFGMKTPYPKLDLVAVPRFAGAMENPGLVTIAAGILIVDPRRTSEADREFLGGVIAHELAHLWFGDLVTLQWWDDLWLNEAFATWMSEKVAIAWKPDLGGRVLEIADRVSALRENRWPDSRSILRPLAGEQRIADRFDVLTYRKGGAIVGMLEQLAGEDSFRRSMRKYIHNHAFASAASPGLLEVLSGAQKRTLQDYLTQPGVPIVDVAVSCEGSAVSLRVEQTPYRLLSAPEPDAQRWHIPFCVRYPRADGLFTSCAVLDGPSATVTLETTECPAWVRPNLGGAGYFYASMSDDPLWALAGSATHSEAEASWLVESVDAQLHAGRLSRASALQALRLLARAGHTHTVKEIARVFFELEAAIEKRSLLATEVEIAFGQRARSAGLVPKPGEDRGVTETRDAIVGLAARVGGDAKLRQQAQKLTNTWLDGGEEPALLSLTLRIAALGGDGALFDRLLDRLRRDSSRRVDIAVGSALGSFEDAIVTRRALELLAGNDLDWQSKLALAAQVLLRHEAQDAALDYLSEHASEVPAQLVAALPAMASSLCSAEHREVVAALMDARSDIPENEKRRTLDHIDQCAALREFAKK